MDCFDFDKLRIISKENSDGGMAIKQKGWDEINSCCGFKRFCNFAPAGSYKKSAKHDDTDKLMGGVNV